MKAWLALASLAVSGVYASSPLSFESVLKSSGANADGFDLHANMGGNQVSYEDHEYYAVVYDSQKVGICKGVLVHPSFVLTSAGCAQQDFDYVFIGDEEAFKVSEVSVHPSYPHALSPNLALLKLVGRSNKKPIKLATEAKAFSQAEAVLTGANKRLFQSSYDIIASDTCVQLWLDYIWNIVKSDSTIKEQEREKVMDGARWYMKSIIPDSVCALSAQQKSCQDDFGAPLFLGGNHDQELVAVLFKTSHQCDGKVPAVFASVAKQIGWITREISKMSALASPLSYSSADFIENHQTSESKSKDLSKDFALPTTILLLLAPIFVALPLLKKTLRFHVSGAFGERKSNRKQKPIELIPPAEAEIREAREKLELQQALQ